MLGCESRAAAIASWRNRARVRVVGREVGAQDLDRHPPGQHRVVGDPHRRHAAARERLDQAVAAAEDARRVWSVPRQHCGRSADDLERHSDDAGPGVGADDRSDHAGDDVVAREDRVEQRRGARRGRARCRASTARCSIFPSAAFAASSFSAFERVRTLPASSTMPSRTSITGLIDSTVPSSARALPTRPPRLRNSSVSSVAKSLVRSRRSTTSCDDRLERVAVGRPPGGGEAEVAEAHRRALRVDHLHRDVVGRPPPPPPAPPASWPRGATTG